ncbi:uncharacterized protein LOC105697900 [Orussus abietinus]|uniref:uncharacterized protein LOC105697900 n=1 Tax=Orussus abietinus TaxID=222816 RepID=UPI000626BE69|nr:uncharacterized protein LOC105697900 [Orussus abietinus]
MKYREVLVLALLCLWVVSALPVVPSGASGPNPDPEASGDTNADENPQESDTVVPAKSDLNDNLAPENQPANEHVPVEPQPAPGEFQSTPAEPQPVGNDVAKSKNSEAPAQVEKPLDPKPVESPKSSEAIPVLPVETTPQPESETLPKNGEKIKASEIVATQADVSNRAGDVPQETVTRNPQLTAERLISNDSSGNSEQDYHRTTQLDETNQRLVRRAESLSKLLRKLAESADTLYDDLAVKSASEEEDADDDDSYSDYPDYPDYPDYLDRSSEGYIDDYIE